VNGTECCVSDAGYLELNPELNR